MKNLIFKVWLAPICTLVALAVVLACLLETKYRSVQYRRCIYEAIDSKPMDKECKRLLDRRKKRWIFTILY